MFIFLLFNNQSDWIPNKGRICDISIFLFYFILFCVFFCFHFVLLEKLPDFSLTITIFFFIECDFVIIFFIYSTIRYQFAFETDENEENECGASCYLHGQWIEMPALSTEMSSLISNVIILHIDLYPFR